MTHASQAKIALEGPHGEVETLWANVVGTDLYALDNLPWYAYHVSLGDIIEAHRDAAGQLRLSRIIRKSGNRTIRVILELTSDQRHTFESQQTLAGLLERGCSYEGSNKLFIAVNIPPAVELSEIAEYLTESKFEWEYADPTFEELFPGEVQPPDA